MKVAIYMHFAITALLPLKLSENICNYHDQSWRFLILKAKQNVEAEIRYQCNGYIRAFISLVIKLLFKIIYFAPKLKTYLSHYLYHTILAQAS